MAKLQKFRIVEEKPVPSSRFRQTLEALRGVWMGPISVSSPDIARIFGSTPTATGVQVDHQTALNYSAVWAAVDLISSQIGNLPLVLYSKDSNGGKTRMDWHPLYRLIHDRPNPETSAFIFRQTLQAHALTWGNAYAVIRRKGDGRPGALDIITPDRVSPYRRSAGNPLEYEITQPDGGRVYVLDSDMLHIPGLSFNGIQGYSVIAKARETIALGLATEKFGGEFFGNGATFGGVLSSKGPRPDENTVKTMRESLNSRHQGVERAHKMLLTWNDTTYQQLGVPPDDAQFLETRRFQVDEIARWFNIPTHKLKELQNGTNRSTTEQQNLEYYIDCLEPWLERWEQELSEKLIAPSERNLQEIEFVSDGLLRGDIAARGDFHAKQFSTASVTPNEIRRVENLNPIPGGDDAFVAFNLLPVSLAQKYWETTIEEKAATIEQTKASTEKIKNPPEPLAPVVDQQARDIERLTEERDLARSLAHQMEESRDLARHEAAETLLTLTKVQGQLQGTETERDWFKTISETAVDEAKRANSRAQVFELGTKSAEAVNAELRERVVELDAAKKTIAEQDRELTHLSEQAAVVADDRDLFREQIKDCEYRLRGTKTAVRLVLRHVAQCLVAREGDRARKAQRSPEKLSQWATDFYPLHEDFCRENLLSPVLAWRTVSGQDDSPLDWALSAYLEEGRKQIQAVAAESDPETLAPNLEKLLRRWETSRVDALVTALTKETL